MQGHCCVCSSCVHDTILICSCGTDNWGKRSCSVAACAEVEKQTHQAIETKDMGQVKEVVQQRLAQIQPSKLQIANDLIEEFVTGGCFPPVNAICGGLLANEMLKAVSKKGDPINNFLFYDLVSGAAVQQRHG